MSAIISVVPHVFAEYLDQPRWIGWKYENKNGKENKSPIDPRSGNYAKSTDPQTWSNFETAWQSIARLNLTGPGIILGRGLGGVDLDGCRDPQTGAITQWAQEIIDEFRSYTEISPSGTGVKIFAAGAPQDLPVNTISMPTPPINGKAAKIEVFVHSRYFAVTGQILDSSPDEISNCGEYGGAWDRLISMLAKHVPPQSSKMAVVEMSASLKLALEQREGLHRLWTEGKDGGKDRSRNDASLACALAAAGFPDADIESALRNYKLGQIGQGFLKGTTASRQIVRLLGMAATVRRSDVTGPIETVEIPDTDIIRPSSLHDKVIALYRTRTQSGADPGWPTVKEHWTLRRGDWTLVTGIPSHGKSSFVDAVMVNLSRSAGWKWGVWSAENLPQELHVTNLLEVYVGRPFDDGAHLRMRESEITTGMNWLDEYFRFIAPPEDEETIDRLLADAEKLVSEGGLDGLVFDPWNEMSHYYHGDTETEYVSKSLKKIRRFAKRMNVHIILVAHPAKLKKEPTLTDQGRVMKYPIPTPYDVSGSAHFRNKADCCLCVWRDESQPGTAVLYVQKIRRKFVGKIGRVDLKYDVVTGRYSEPYIWQSRSREPGDDDE